MRSLTTSSSEMIEVSIAHCSWVVWTVGCSHNFKFLGSNLSNCHSFICLCIRSRKEMCICRDSRYSKKLKRCGTEKMSSGWEWKLLTSTFVFVNTTPINVMWPCCRTETPGSLRTMLSDVRTCQIHEEKVKTSEDLLRRRELAVTTMEDTYEQKLKNELSRYFHLLNMNYPGHPSGPIQYISILTLDLIVHRKTHGFDTVVWFKLSTVVYQENEPSSLD